ncbi:Fibronectin type III domain-containing protein 5 [Triplophysa tibetana]|uniref:Fibronectin type III domain-containing protein 5 n=1 Tax=Triplophysa tibetana TaxID=1572043 RepID=A0A5A9P8P7_9TELE|nr:Fibronectin type III domain-containing protein 5 [Triplophysa tibetana]
MRGFFMPTPLLVLSCFGASWVVANSLVAPVNVSIKDLKSSYGLLTWDTPDGESVIGFAITQQKKDVHMLRFIQEVNTTMRSCALWDLEADTDYIVHVQSISVSGPSPVSEPLQFRSPREAVKGSESKDEVTMEEVEQNAQLRAVELIIIVVVLIMWAGVIVLFCRQYDIIKDNEPNNNKDKTKNSSECSTPEHPSGGLLRSRV